MKIQLLHQNTTNPPKLGNNTKSTFQIQPIEWAQLIKCSFLPLQTLMVHFISEAREGKHILTLHQINAQTSSIGLA